MDDDTKQPTQHWTELLDARQLKEVGFSRLYAEEFAHGTEGHNAKLIIAKLADKLDELQGVIPTYIP